MKRRIQTWLAALTLAVSLGGLTATVALPQTSYAACNDTLLTFPAWYKGLTDGQCNIRSPSDPKIGGIQKFVLIIALNIVQILLQAVGYISVFFIIYGGFRFIVDAGVPDAVVRARKTILNAVVGLVISILSVGLVSLIAGAVK